MFYWTGNFIKQTKTAAGGVIWKKLFVKILQYSQRNIYVEMKSLLNKVAEAAYGCFRSGFRRWLFRTFSLGSCFHNHPDSVLLQKYQPLSNQGFKHNSALMPSLKAHSQVWETFLATENPLKMMKNVFYFTSKALFVLKVFKFLS